MDWKQFEVPEKKMSSKANASNKTGGSTKASAAPVAAPLDLYSADKNEISRTLYGQVQWEELLRNGIILQHRDVSELLCRNSFSFSD